MAKDQKPKRSAKNTGNSGDTWTPEQDRQLVEIIEGEKEKGSKGLYKAVETILGRTEQAARLRMMKIRNEPDNRMNKRALALLPPTSKTSSSRASKKQDSRKSMRLDEDRIETDDTPTFNSESGSLAPDMEDYSQNMDLEDPENELDTNRSLNANEYQSGTFQHSGLDSITSRRAYSSSQTVDFRFHGQIQSHGLQNTISFAEYTGRAAVETGVIPEWIVERVENACNLVAFKQQVPGQPPTHPDDEEKWTKILELASLAGYPLSGSIIA